CQACGCQAPGYQDAVVVPPRALLRRCLLRRRPEYRDRIQAWLVCRCVLARDHRPARYLLYRSWLRFNRGGVPKGYSKSYGSTFPRRRLDVQIAVNILGSLLYIKKSTSLVDIGVVGFYDLLVKSTPSNSNRDDQLIYALRQKHVDVMGG